MLFYHRCLRGATFSNVNVESESIENSNDSNDENSSTNNNDEENNVNLN